MEIIQTPFGSFNVYFNRISDSETDMYHISFVDKNNKLQIMQMQFVNNSWSFMNPELQPDWLLAMEKRFSDLVMKEVLKEQIAL
jgi:hypothetical protein